MSPLAPADATYGVPYQLSRHTIVDVDALSARLNTLLSNPELRRAMGAEGRRIVDERFDWRVVIDRYRSLFAEQRQRLRDERPPSRRPLSVARVFGHYASAILAPETIVQCTDHGNRLLQALATRPQGAEGAVVAEILSVTRTPTPFAIWDGDSHTTSKEAAVALLKSGALRVVR